MKNNKDISDIKTIWDYFYIHPKLSLRQWLYWFLFAIIVYFFGELLIYLFEDQRYPITHISLTILLAISGAFHNYAKKEFVHNLRKARNLLLHIEEKDIDAWIINQTEKTFVLSSWQSILSTIIVVILGFITLCYLGFPFHSLILNIFASIKMIIIFALCGHGTYILYRLLVTLIDIGRKVRDETPELMLQDPGLLAIRFFYSFVSIFIFCAYLTFVFAIFYSPYEFIYILKVWLTLSSLYPFGFFLMWILSYYRIHEAIKSKILTKLNKQSIKAMQALENFDTSNAKYNDYLYMVGIFITLQNNIATKKAWSLDIVGIIIAIISIVPILIQIYYIRF